MAYIYKDYKTHVISTNRERLTSGFRPPDRPDHTGMDFTDTDRLELKQDVYILAFADGTVTDTTIGSLVGYNADIEHEGRILTRYNHMKAGSVKVKAGQVVKKGDILGVMGTTGNSTGIHLHFEVKENSTKWSNGVWVNPEPYLLGQKTIASANEPVAVPLKAGDRVKLISSASKYATGEAIPAWVKTGAHTVQQVKDDRVLLKEVVSWVYAKDVVKG